MSDDADQLKRARAVKVIIEARRAQDKYEAEKSDLAQNVVEGFLPIAACVKIFGASQSTLQRMGGARRQSSIGYLYDAAHLFAFVAENKARAAERKKTSRSQIETALIRKHNAQAEKAEIQAKIFRRDFVSAEKVAEVWQDVTTIYRQTLLNASKKLLASLSRAKDDKARAKILREWAEGALEETKINADRYLASFEVDDEDTEAEEDNDRKRVGRKKLLPDDE